MLNVSKLIINKKNDNVSWLSRCLGLNKDLHFGKTLKIKVQNHF